MVWSRGFRMRGNMYSISVSYSQIYASLLPGAQSSSYGSHFLIRLVDGRMAVFPDDHDHRQQQDEPAGAARVRGGDAAPESAALHDGPHGFLPVLPVEHRRRDLPFS